MVVDQPSDAAADPDTADLVFGALADPTRRDIVQRVLAGPSSVSALAQRYAMSFAAVQRHVAVLERAGLVTKEPHGRERLVRGRVDTVRAAARLLDRYEDVWRDRVGRMADILATDETDETHRADETGGAAGTAVPQGPQGRHEPTPHHPPRPDRRDTP